MDNSLKQLDEVTQLRIRLKNVIISLKKEIYEHKHNKKKYDLLLEDNKVLKNLYNNTLQEINELEVKYQKKIDKLELRYNEKLDKLDLDSNRDPRIHMHLVKTNKEIIAKNKKLKKHNNELKKLIWEQSKKLKYFKNKDYINLKEKYVKALKEIDSANIKKKQLKEHITENRNTLVVFRKHLKNLTNDEEYNNIIDELIKVQGNES